MPQDREAGIEGRGGAERPLGDMVESVIEDVRNIVRAEARLAGAELREKARQSARPGILLGGAAILGFFAVACFTTTCIVALNIVLPLWLCALLVGVLLAAVAGGALVAGRMALDEVDLLPRQTLETLRDNLEWIRTRTR